MPNNSGILSFGFKAKISGISPSKRLSFKLNDFSGRLAGLRGIFSVRMFYDAWKRSNEVRSKNASGISPERWLWNNTICLAFFIRSSESLRSNCFARGLRFPMDSGISLSGFAIDAISISSSARRRMFTAYSFYSSDLGD